MKRITGVIYIGKYQSIDQHVNQNLSFFLSGAWTLWTLPKEEPQNRADALRIFPENSALCYIAFHCKE